MRKFNGIFNNFDLPNFSFITFGKEVERCRYILKYIALNHVKY